MNWSSQGLFKVTDKAQQRIAALAGFRRPIVPPHPKRERKPKRVAQSTFHTIEIHQDVRVGWATITKGAERHQNYRKKPRWMAAHKVGPYIESLKRNGYTVAMVGDVIQATIPRKVQYVSAA